MYHQQTEDIGKQDPVLHEASQEKTKCSVHLGSDFTSKTSFQEGTKPWEQCSSLGQERLHHHLSY